MTTIAHEICQTFYNCYYYNKKTRLDCTWYELNLSATSSNAGTT